MNNNNAGITRINILGEKTGPGAHRFEESVRLRPDANVIYRMIFDRMGYNLMPGDTTIDCTKDEFAAGYDIKYGSDIFLQFTTGMQATLQEKFLSTDFDTVTVEYYNDPKTKHVGDWFTMRVAYYFVGYHVNCLCFRKWILLDWPAIQRATSRGLISWGERCNSAENAKASFCYVPFDLIPRNCIIEVCDG